MDPLAGFGSWSETELDEAVREVKREPDEDFERISGLSVENPRQSYR